MVITFLSPSLQKKKMNNYCTESISKPYPPPPALPPPPSTQKNSVLSPPLTPALSYPFDKRQSYHSANRMPYPPIEEYRRQQHPHYIWVNPQGGGVQQQTMYPPPSLPRTPPQKQPTIRQNNNKHSCNYPNCQWSFKRFEHLKRHMLVHTGERPHMCPYPGCGKRFSRSDNFHAHYRTHEKKAFVHNGSNNRQKSAALRQEDELKKPHACTDCDKRFRRLEHLRRHQRIHTHEQPFQCNFPGCLKTFSRSDNLTQHRKTHERRGFEQQQPVMMSWQNNPGNATVGC